MIWVLILIAVGIAYLLLYCLMATTKENDRDARHTEHAVDPFSEVTITRF